MPRELTDRLRAFRTEHFPRYERQYRALAQAGQHPGTLFIGCSDFRPFSEYPLPDEVA